MTAAPVFAKVCSKASVMSMPSSIFNYVPITPTARTITGNVDTFNPTVLNP